MGSLSPRKGKKREKERNLGTSVSLQKSNMASCHIKNNLAALRQLPRVALNNIRDLPDAFITVGAYLILFCLIFEMVGQN